MEVPVSGIPPAGGAGGVSSFSNGRQWPRGPAPAQGPATYFLTFGSLVMTVPERLCCWRWNPKRRGR